MLSAGATVMPERLYRPVSDALARVGLKMVRDDCIQFAKKTVHGSKYPIMGRFIINGLAPIATDGKFDKMLLAHYLANIDIGGGIKVSFEANQGLADRLKVCVKCLADKEDGIMCYCAQHGGAQKFFRGISKERRQANEKNARRRIRDAIARANNAPA